MVRVGQTVQVKVLEVDEARKRISLTMRLDDEATPTRKNTSSSTKASRPQRPERTERKAPDAANNAMAAAFAKLKR